MSPGRGARLGEVTSRVLVIVGGSIAAVKAPSLLRRLRDRGYQLSVIATRAALRFVTELSLTTAAAGPVATDETWFEASPSADHLSLSRADQVVVVGASADLLARAASARASDLASATLLSVRCGVLWVPAMNERMWTHPGVQANVARLRGWGHDFLGPETGAFGTLGEGSGIGRMSEPETIADAVATRLDRSGRKDLTGRKVVVSAGPTREYLDPVRFISNPSSGKMGFAVAEAARERGAEVVLVSGPVHLPTPAGVAVVPVQSALEMRDAMVSASAGADIVVMTAAVADYRAAEQASEKQAKTHDEVTLALVKNPDILATLGADKGTRVLIGFAMETHAGLERAAAKAKAKNADFIVLNYPTRTGSGFGGDHNEVTFVRADGTAEALPRLTKREVAERILDEAARIAAQHR